MKLKVRKPAMIYRRMDLFVRMRRVAVVVAFLTALLPGRHARGQTIGYNEESGPVRFGVSRIAEALYRTGKAVNVKTGTAHDADIMILVTPDDAGLQPEGFRIFKKNRSLVVQARHSAGAMYGALHVAEQIRMGRVPAAISPVTANPHFTVRALKFNLPWSSYRTGAAMEAHMETCRDLTFWKAFLDRMAENRFNVLSLWNVHPFSYMVKPANFPMANAFGEREMEEWKRFWTALFRMCRERAIEPFIVNWNIAVSPEFAKHYGVRERNDTSAVVRRYTREVVTQVINEYPDLAGIGITLADWMSNFRQPGSPLPEMTPAQREEWITETVVAGMKAAERPVKFLHRSVLSADPAEMRRVIDEAGFPDTTLVEIKFNWSHGHSTPRLLLTHDSHSGEVENHYWHPLPDNYRIQWMVRNEDFFILRWGQPRFIREHIRENSRPWVNGYFVGSEGYIPARDLSHRDDDHRDWEYAFDKQWLFYRLWGRLLYDPSTPDEVFQHAFREKYGAENAGDMLAVYQAASNMPLRLASFHAATWDYTLYAEGFLAPFPSNACMYDTVSAFISIDELIHHPTLDPRFLGIHEFVTTGRGGHPAEDRVTPLMLADSLEGDSRFVMEFVHSMRPVSGALDCELDDLETWANLGLYFADKLRAGVALQTFRVSGGTSEKEKAVRLLRRCLGHWKKVARITSAHYDEMPYIDHEGSGSAHRDARTFSWVKYLPQVERDITIAEKAIIGKDISEGRK